ncbi:MAG: helix-turn-helix domain-containing protein [Myxococcota bacterium]
MEESGYTRPDMTTFGQLLKHWRRKRQISQLQLAIEIGMSPRHVSFLETGRSRPRPQTIARLVAGLSIPPSHHNELYRAAGLSPVFTPERLEAPALQPFREVIRQLLERHSPYPGFVLDHRYQLVDANPTGRKMFPIPGPSIIEVLSDRRRGRAFVENWEEVAWHTLTRLRQEALVEPELLAMCEQLERNLEGTQPPEQPTDLISCPRLRLNGTVLETISTVVRFDTANDPTLAAIRIELLFPRNAETAAFFEAFAESS